MEDRKKTELVSKDKLFFENLGSVFFYWDFKPVEHYTLRLGKPKDLVSARKDKHGLDIFINHT